MTKKDYIRIGGSLAEYRKSVLRAYPAPSIADIVFDEAVAAVCRSFKEDNPAFNPSVFWGFVRGECGPTPPRGKRK